MSLTPNRCPIIAPDFDIFVLSKGNHSAMDNESIKQNIRKLREERNLSQRKMAEAIGIARNSYRKLEKGKTRIINDSVVKIAEWAGISLEELILGYMPTEATSALLWDAREQFNERVKNLTEEYNARIETLVKEGEQMKDQIKIMEGYIHTLKSMIALLQKGREEDKND